VVLAGRSAWSWLGSWRELGCEVDVVLVGRLASVLVGRLASVLVGRLASVLA